MSELSFDPRSVKLDHTLTSDRIKEIVSTLFGHSTTLETELVPALAADLGNRQEPLSSYQAFIDICARHVEDWDYAKKGAFLEGHPEIGAPKVTGLSAKEQGTAEVDPRTLERLKELNAEYRKRYPGLIYLTFVNGRSREAIVDEMNDFLNSDSSDTKSPESKEWKAECDRGVQAVIEISRDRLTKLGWDHQV